ncbi:MAG: Fur family transcriptional regulator [Clostridiales bacterium]|nr:Fur family transcriptional regulator [Clostridiales bacterium]
MAEYETKQRRMLLDFLNAHPDGGFSVEELYSGLCAANPGEQVPGKSTLYRLIAKLVSEGLVKRFPGEHGRQFSYQIVACASCGARDAHLHLKCTACGCLYHMDHAISERIMDEVLQRSDFSLDEKETVLFGVCRDCRQRRGK